MTETRWLCRVATVSLFAGLTWMPAASAQERPAPVRRPGAQRPAVRKPIAERPARVTPAAGTRQFTRKDVTGKHEFMVTLAPGSAVDGRLLDYLERRLEIKELDPRTHADELTMARPKTGAPRPSAAEEASEVRISMKATSAGTDATRFVWLWPDGFDMPRPAVLRVKADFAAGIAQASSLSFATDEEERPVLKSHPTGSQTRLTGLLQCRAPEGSGTTDNPLRYLKLKVDSLEATTDTNGRFSVNGSFGPGRYELRLEYDSRVPIGTATGSTRLMVMNEGHNGRHEDVNASASTASGSAVDLGTVTVSSLDCELWRLGVVVLDDYHQQVKKSPPAGHLRIKRWAGVTSGTPYTYYDYLVIATDFARKYNTKEWREQTAFHEFGHSIRHAADGSSAHWGWDNFRWAYARNHDTCEIFNTQFTFNEGWANYWENRAKGVQHCGGKRYIANPTAEQAANQLNLDWNETMIQGRLTHLASSRGVTPAVMVSVLESNEKKIHSLWDFEKKYCGQVSLPNANCTSDRKPMRKAPASCPPGYVDDGATCRLDNIKSKPSYGRGAGVAPKQCGSDQEYDAGLCYKKCRSGYHGVGPVCWTSCPEGHKDDGATCRRDAKIISADNSRCPGYDKCGLTLKKGCSRCPEGQGYHNDGCTCRRDAHITSKDSYGRGAGKVPKSCGANKEYDAGLCYEECRSGHHGVGPVCWGQCASGYKDHGATCYKDPSIMVKY